MPTLAFLGAFTYCGAACTVYSRKNFDPAHLLRTLADGGATFTSLVPTHYIMMLGLPAGVRERHNVDAVTKLLISSAPARRDTKLTIMDFFNPGCSSPTARPKPDVILDWYRNRIAGYKRPRSVSFIREDEMPRTATGKVLHRVLRSRLGAQASR